VFATNEALEPGDTDNVAAGNDFPDGNFDVYKRANGTTTRLSTGPGDHNGNVIIDVLAMSADGNRALLQTNGGTLVDEPGPVIGVHLFVRDQSAATTTRINTKEIEDPALFAGGNQDLTRLFWLTGTDEAGDGDGRLDLFQWHDGAITLLSPGPSGSPDFARTEFAAASPDGTRVIFETSEPLVPADADQSTDVYAAQGGALELLSTGPTGGNGDRDALFAGASADATRVFFTTSENLTADDTDTADVEGGDVYERAGGATTLLTPGAGDGDARLGTGGDQHAASVSADGTRAIVATDDRLAPADTDGTIDLYDVSGGTATLLTTGPSGGNGAQDVRYLGGSADMRTVVFATGEVLTPDDLDGRTDVYVRDGGVTTRLSGMPGTGNGQFDAGVPEAFTRASGHIGLGAVSADGSKVVIQSNERLTPDDTDSRRDLFMSTHTPVQPTPTPTPTPTPSATPVPTATPAPAATPAARPAALPRIGQVVTFPSTHRCVSRRRFAIRLRVPKGLAAISAAVFVNGRRVAVRRGARLRSAVDLRGLPKGRFKVRIAIKLRDGRTIAGTRTYRTCTRARRNRRPPKV
jgi:WD40 repeat protein